MTTRREFLHRFVDMMEQRLWRLLPKEASESEMIKKSLDITHDLAKHIEEAVDGRI